MDANIWTRLRPYYIGLVNIKPTRPRVILLIITVVSLFVIVVNPRLYHLSPRHVLPLLPSPHHTKTVDTLLEDVKSNLTSLFARHGRTLPEPVFPIQELTFAQENRYDLLRPVRGHTGLYVFVAITRQIQDELLDLVSAMTVVVNALGPANVAFSIVEGPSDDMTPHVLEEVLRPRLMAMGVPSEHLCISTNAPKIDFWSGNRIEILADLRNQALAPVVNGDWLDRPIRQIVYFNDVYLKAEHVLELMYQHEISHADLTAAWDWYRREPAYFYDVWVARSLETGDLFYPIGSNWSPSENILHDSPKSRAAYEALEPFQVFSAWNGMVVLNPKPFLPPYNVRFRRSSHADGECAASECTLICSDFWKHGFGKIQVVPSIQLAYERDVAVQTEYRMQQERHALGWEDGVPRSKGRLGGKGLQWQKEPPAKVRCNAWPEKNGLDGNVWAKTTWVDPWLS